MDLMDYRFDLVIHEELPLSGFILLVILVSLMLFGLLGNTLTLLVVWLRPHMRSSTDLYLSSMAVSDLLNLLLLYLDIHKLMIGLGDFACRLTVFLSECCYYCTILHITFLSLERYLVVCWPITSKTLVTHRRTRAVIGCLWLGAAVSAAPFLVMVKVVHKGKEHEFEYCGLSHSSFSSGLMLPILIIYNLYFLVPLCILGLVFILIGRTLRLCPQSSLNVKSHQHTVKMLGVIFLAFVLCWLPYIVCQTMLYDAFTAGPDSRHNYIMTGPFVFCFLMAWALSRLSSGINPLVYHLMSARYRQAVRSLVHTHCLTPSH